MKFQPTEKCSGPNLIFLNTEVLEDILALSWLAFMDSPLQKPQQHVTLPIMTLMLISYF